MFRKRSTGTYDAEETSEKLTLLLQLSSGLYIVEPLIHRIVYVNFLSLITTKSWTL